MQSISFASGGDPDTIDYVAYVAKDPRNNRGMIFIASEHYFRHNCCDFESVSLHCQIILGSRWKCFLSPCVMYIVQQLVLFFKFKVK